MSMYFDVVAKKKSEEPASEITLFSCGTSMARRICDSGEIQYSEKTIPLPHKTLKGVICFLNNEVKTNDEYVQDRLRRIDALNKVELNRPLAEEEREELGALEMYIKESEEENDELKNVIDRLGYVFNIMYDNDDWELFYWLC